MTSMNEWFTLEAALSADSFFWLWQLRSRSGLPADRIAPFVDQLVEHIVGYAHRTNTSIAGTINARYRVEVDAIRLARRGLERLLEDQGGVYRNLMGFAGECLAHWIHQTLAPPLAMSIPKPHSTEPGFDL